MKKPLFIITRLGLLGLFICSSLLFTSVNTHSDGSGWLRLAEGIDFQEFHLPGPFDIFVARMERSNPKVTIDTTIAQGKLAIGRETVRDMVTRYSQAINNWENKLGNRNRVVVAINGYYFDPQTGTPWRGQFQSGWYVKRFDNFQNGSGFAWTQDRNAFIGGCINHPQNKQVVTYLNTSIKQKITGINIPRVENGLIIYTPQYSDTTDTAMPGVEVSIKLTQPLQPLPLPNMIIGTVDNIYSNTGHIPILFDHVILSASGSASVALAKNAKNGANIGISQTIAHYEPNCKTPNPISWANVYAGLGGDYNFLRDGDIQYFNKGQANVRDPRTAVAYNDRYIFFIVVDGRNPGISEGMTITELAEFARDELNARWGISLDSGGSSTMVINGKVVNNTYCNFNDCAKHPIPPPSSSSSVTQIPTYGSVNPSIVEPGQLLESLVGNGLMMVYLEPASFSKTFDNGEKTTVLGESELLLGPGTNYARFASIPPDTEVEIMPHDLNGVLAKNSYWWFVRYNGVSGWVPEEHLLRGFYPLRNIIMQP